MNQLEIGPKSKEALSWMVISEVLAQSGLDLDIAVLHPGGGQYNSLSLVTFDGHPVVQINRNGVNALVGDELIENIFSIAAKSPGMAGRTIVRSLDIDSSVPLSANRKRRIELATQVGNFLALNLGRGSFCEWAWNDSTYGSGPNPNVQAFPVPDSWKVGNGLFKDTNWESIIFLLFHKDSPFAAINLQNGEVINFKGAKLVNLISTQELNGLPKCHVGSEMTWKNSEGDVVFQDETHVAYVRMTRRIYSEEYYTMPVEKPIFEFSCDEEEAVNKWNSAERILDLDI